jgi:hypothetical protein
MVPRSNPTGSNFVLREVHPSNMMTLVAMENKFQAQQTSPTLEHSPPGQEELRRASRPVRAATGTSA